MGKEWILNLFEGFWFEYTPKIIKDGEKELKRLLKEDENKLKGKVNFIPNVNLEYFKID